MKIKRLAFWDFDGTFAFSPTPELGKGKWEEHHQKPWVWQGWWGRPESMDDDVFDIQLRDDVQVMYKELCDDCTLHFIHTSRLSKFKPNIEKILAKFGIKMHDILTIVPTLDKGQRIVEVLDKMKAAGYEIEEVHFTDDRLKEITAVERVRHILEARGVQLTVVKVQSDATD